MCFALLLFAGVSQCAVTSLSCGIYCLQEQEEDLDEEQDADFQDDSLLDREEL